MSEEEKKKKYYVTLSYLAHATLGIEAKDPDEAGRLALQKSDCGDIKIEDFRDDDSLWGTAEVDEVYDPDTEESRRSVYCGQPPERPEKMRREYKLRYGVSGFLAAVRIREIVYEDENGNISTAAPMFETKLQTDVDEAVVCAVRESEKFQRAGNRIVAVKYDILQVPKANDSSVYVNVQGSAGVELNGRKVLVLSNKPLGESVFLTENGILEEFDFSRRVSIDDKSIESFDFVPYSVVMTDDSILRADMFRTGEMFQTSCRGINFKDYMFVGEYVSMMAGRTVK